MTPPEYGVSTDIKQNLAVTVQFEDLSVTIFIFIFFVKLILIYKKCIFHECSEKIKNYLRKKVLVWVRWGTL